MDKLQCLSNVYCITMGGLRDKTFMEVNMLNYLQVITTLEIRLFHSLTKFINLFSQYIIQ